MKPRILHLLVSTYLLYVVSANRKPSDRFLEHTRFCTVCQHGGEPHVHTATSSGCSRRPVPPASGFISCTESHTSVNCVGTCLGGHNFPDGNSRMILQCDTDRGVWYPHSSFPNCVEGVAVNERYRENEQYRQQHENTNQGLQNTVARCQKPEAPANGYYHCTYDDTHMKCLGRCNNGYLFEVGRNREMELECRTESGRWHPYSKFPNCIRESERYRENEQQRPHENTNLRLENTVVRCQRPEAPVNGYYHCTYDETHMKCIGRCNDGYLFEVGRKQEMELECRTESGRWHPYYKFPNCIRESERHRENEQNQRQHENNNQRLENTVARCQRPEAPVNGYYHCTYDETHMKCVGKCNDGYLFEVGRNQEMELECRTESGRWHPYSKFPNCIREGGRQHQESENVPGREYLAVLQRCPKPSAPTDGSYSCTYDTVQMVCIGRCHTSYFFPGKRTEMQLTCRADNGFWNPYSKFPDCTKETERIEDRRDKPGNRGESTILQRCQKPSPPSNGRYDCKYDETKMTCVGRCNSGYAFPGSLQETQMQCYARNGQWYPSKFHDCIRAEGEDETQQYEQMFRETLERCKTPPAPRNGYLHCKYNKTDMACIGSCNSGYFFPGRLQEMQLHCQTESAYWYPYRNFPDCTREGVNVREPYEEDRNTNPEEIYKEILARCKPPSAPANGFFNCRYNQSDMTCTGTCNAGYLFPGRLQEIQTQCHAANAYWYPYREFPDCARDAYDERDQTHNQQRPESDDSRFTETLRRCRKPDSPFPGRVSCNYDTEEMTCVGTCSQGYYFPSGSTTLTLQCRTREGLWSPHSEFPQCRSSGIHTCRDCTENEGRGNSELTITLRNCRRPEPPVPGNVECQYDSAGMNCTGRCKRGYYFPDRTQQKVIQCLTHRGVWNPINAYPECTRHGPDRYEEDDTENTVTVGRCERLSSPSPGRVSCNYDSDGMSCFGTCSLGYYFPGGRAEMVLNCSAREGIWRPLPRFPSCEYQGDNSCQDCHQREGYEAYDLSVTLNRCRRPSSPIPGRVSCRYDYRGMNCTGTCKEGYYFPDGTRTRIIQCSTNTGVWHPVKSFPYCIEYGRRGTYHEETESRVQDGGLAATLARCRPPSSPVPGRVACSYNATGMACTGLCTRGYAFPGGSTRMVLECQTRRGNWFPTDKFPQCEAPGHGIYRDDQDDLQQVSNANDALSVTLSRCKTPHSPVPGEASCQYDSKGMNCTGKCDESYHFKYGGKQIVIQCLTLLGVWSPADKYPDCVKTEFYSRTELEQMNLERQREERLLQVTLSTCRRPTPPSFGYLQCGHDTVGMNCTGHCRLGYTFPDGTMRKNVECITERGVWYPQQSFPSCIQVDRRDGYEEGAHPRTPSEEESRLAETLIKCKRPIAPTNGNVYCRHDAFGMNCTGRCDSGHYYVDGTREKVHRCFTINGTWIPRFLFPSCFESTTPHPVTDVPPPPPPQPGNLEKEPLERTLRNCLKPEKPSNGYMICQHNPVEMNCTGRCNYRHHYPDGTNIKILHCTGETGVWRPSRYFPECTLIDSGSRVDVGNEEIDQRDNERLLKITLNRCRRPSSPTPGNVSCNYDRHGMNCTGICSPGYKFSNGRRQATLRCNTERAEWFPFQTFPSCVSVVSTNKCRKPISPRYGRLSCRNDSSSMTCTAQCLTGYSFPDNTRRMDTRCTFVDGVWRPFESFPDCSRTGTTHDTTGEETQQIPDRIENVEQGKDNSEVTCKDRPKPPFRGFLNCMEEHNAVKCIGTCLPDYKFTRGESTMTLTCSLSTGRWSPRSTFSPCYLENTPRPNQPDRYEHTTSRPATGDRVEGVHQETDAETNRKLDIMCVRPLTPKGGFIHCVNEGGFKKCKGTCDTGYTFPNDRDYIFIRCSLLGTWTPRRNFPDCVAAGRHTEGDDREYDRNTGTGSENRHTLDTGNRGTVQGYCRRPPTPKSGYIYCVYNSNVMECTGKCGPGYRFPTGETTLIHTCEQRTNRWYPTEAFPDCKPVCDSPCHNGGICVRPNQCFCPQEYRGDYCQHPLSNCDPRQLRFPGSIRCNHTMEETVCELGCPFGTKLDYPSYRIARCSLEGSWSPNFVPRCIEDSSSLATHSNNDCGGSQCSSAITEGLCQKPATPRPGTIRCIFNRLIMECTGKCADGYRFTDGRHENVRTCDKRTGVWSPSQSFPECNPICERGCQNGGECLAPNACICPMRYRGDQCQYHFSNCDPHRLKFAGSIRCNHTTKETVCQLGCPEGTVLDQPAYDKVRCSLEGIWTPSVLPRCVEDATYERRLLEINRQSGMRYDEHQYRQSEISRTQAEGFENENAEDIYQDREGTGVHDRQTKDDDYEQRLSRLEQEDRDLYQQNHRGNNRGTVTDERDEFSRNEGRFKHYNDFLHTGKEDYELQRRGEHRRTSSHQTEETEEHRLQYYRQSVNKQKTETYREHSSQSQLQFSRYRKQHEHSGNAMCTSCS